jgi:hypothetical protein
MVFNHGIVVPERIGQARSPDEIGQAGATYSRMGRRGINQAGGQSCYQVSWTRLRME